MGLVDFSYGNSVFGGTFRFISLFVAFSAVVPWSRTVSSTFLSRQPQWWG